MLVTVNGKRWDMVFASTPGCDGECDPPTKKKKQIRLHSRLKRDPRRLLEVIIHECLHAADWSKAEEWVEPTAEDIARALWKAGFRLSEPNEM